MSNANAPVAATVSEIKAAFPKAKSDFVVKCLEKSLPMAEVAREAYADLATENEALQGQLESLSSELATLKAAPAPEPTPEPVARGAKPVARAQSGSAPTAKARWNDAIKAVLPACGGNHGKAVIAANRQNPGLREAMLSEVNAR